MYEKIKTQWAWILIILTVLIYFGYRYVYTDNSSSSFIEDAKYSPFTNSLDISINGKDYTYCNVPLVTWVGYKNAKSKGSFYNSVIKGKFSCSANSEDEWVFDHIIALCLGGGDFGTTSFSEFANNDFGVSNELATSCFADMVLEERNILSESGYKRLPDGSWIDKEEKFPSCDFETNLETAITKNFQECIN